MAHYVVDSENTNLDAGDDDDTVLVYASGAVVNGGGGSDWLSANINITAEPVDGGGGGSEPNIEDIATEMNGDAGDDHIRASLRGTSDDPFGAGLNFVTKLTGGGGSDQIWLDIFNYQTQYDAALDGGAGADDIRVSIFGDGDSLYGSGALSVEAGGGNDTVNIYARGYAGGDVTVRAGAGNDLVESSALFVDVTGGLVGTSRLYGGSGNDTLNGNAVDNNADGGSGNDRITLIGDYNTADGGTGGDRIKVTAALGQAWHGGPEFGNNTASGGDGDDAIEGVLAFSFSGFGTNELHGGAGNDRLIATISFDLSPDPSSDDYPLTGEAKSLVYGDAGDDRISVRVIGNVEDGEFAISSELYGGAGNDRLTVRGGEGNILNGGAGNDTLIGGSGSDTLIGLQGDDALQGKGGADIFLFGFIRSGERDRISDFVIGEDVIDLSQIDANRDRAGEQSFRFGTREGTGRAWIEEDPDTTGSLLFADDGHRVLEVLLKDGRAVSADDYSASDFLL